MRERKPFPTFVLTFLLKGDCTKECFLVGSRCMYLVAWLIVGQVVIVTAFIEGFLVHGFGVVKAMSV